MEVVSKEIATKEVNEWLDRMDVPVENRSKENVEPYVKALVAAVQSGDLVFNADETVTQKLKNPMGDGKTKEVVYDFRFEIGDFNKATKGLSAIDEVDWSVARLSLISKEKYPTAFFLKMKRADYFVASKLVVFF